MTCRFHSVAYEIHERVSIFMNMTWHSNFVIINFWMVNKLITRTIHCTTMPHQTKQDKTKQNQIQIKSIETYNHLVYKHSNWPFCLNILRRSNRFLITFDNGFIRSSGLFSSFCLSVCSFLWTQIQTHRDLTYISGPSLQFKRNNKRCMD